jgi:YbbR domain-containing protein
VKIFNNFGYKLSALLIAFVLWAAVQGFRSEELNLDLPIVLEDIPAGVVVVGQSVSTVNVKLEGSRAALRRLQQAPPRYPVSLAGHVAGEPASFPIDREQLKEKLTPPPPRGAEIEAHSPSILIVQLDAVIQRRVRVQADLVGEPPEGYSLVSVSVVPSMLRLEGARQSLRATTEVVTDRIDLSQLRQSTVREVLPILDRPHIWRAEATAEPIRVEIQIKGPGVAEDATGQVGAGADE